MRDFRAHTLYFVFVDRFADGTSNESQEKRRSVHSGFFDNSRTDPYLCWGGDLEGLSSHLDYLSSLGISYLRLTPVFEQMSTLTLDQGHLGAPYHGYWTSDHRRLENRLLPSEEWNRPFSDRNTAFDRLVQACHDRGIRTMLDVVCDRANPGGDDAPVGQLFDDGRWLLSAEQDTLGWFRKGLYRQEHDSHARFDERSASFRGYLRDMLEDWIERGVDGYCFDSVHQMPLWFWQELTSSLRLKHPKTAFCGSASTRGNWEEAMVDFANQAGLRLMDRAFQRRIAEGLCWEDAGGFRRIAQYLEQDEAFEDATSLVTFLDNESGPRLLSLGLPPEHLVIALTLLLTSRGIPCVFYGTEQGLHDDREGGAEPFNRPMMRQFDPDTPAARALGKLTLLRRENLAVQRGHHGTLWLSDDVFVYRRGHGEDRVVVALNRGRDTKVDVVEACLPDGPAIDLLSGTGVFVHHGRISNLQLPAGAARVFAHTAYRENIGVRVLCRLSGYSSRFGETVVITGSAPELGAWDIRKAIPLEYVNRNLWMGDVVFDSSCGKKALYKYAVLDERGNVIRESLMPRQVDVPRESGLEWADRWT